MTFTGRVIFSSFVFFLIKKRNMNNNPLPPPSDSSGHVQNMTYPNKNKTSKSALSIEHQPFVVVKS